MSTGGKLDFKYCGRCYTARDVHPFGFCYTCWKKAGKPKSMKD